MRILITAPGWALAVALGVVPVTAGDMGDPRFEAELEVGPVWQSRNEVEIPNDRTATRVVSTNSIDLESRPL